MLYIYHFHNFEEYYILDVSEELEKKEHSYYLPLLFSNLKLFKPLMSENVSTSSVDLIWQGNADSYQLYCSIDPNFENCLPIEIRSKQLSSDNVKKMNFALFGLFPILLLVYRKRKMMFISMIMLFCFLLIACGTKINVKETLKYRHTITELEKNTIYYWKIVANQSNGISSFSIVKNFRTGD